MNRTMLRANGLFTFGPLILSLNATTKVGTLLFSSPKTTNLLNGEFMSSLHSCMNLIDTQLEDKIRAVILSAPESHHFTAGLDLKEEMQHILQDAPSPTKITLEGGRSEQMPAMRNQQIHALVARYQASISSIARCRVPVIAAIHKHCIGGGVDIATACDARYATKDAVFSVREARVGITADIGSLQRLSRIVGEGAARELVFTARDFGASEAKNLHFVNGPRVFENYSEMMEYVDFEICQKIAKNSPLAVQGAKNVLNWQTERGVQDSLDYVRLWNSAFLKSDDVLLAATAFAKKEEPHFRDFVVMNQAK